MSEETKNDEVVVETTQEEQSIVVAGTEELGQNEGARTTEVVGEDPGVVDNPIQELTIMDRELLLLELQAIGTMMGAQYMNPRMRGTGEGKPQRFTGYFDVANIYNLDNLYILRKRADQICEMLGIELSSNRHNITE